MTGPPESNRRAKLTRAAAGAILPPARDPVEVDGLVREKARELGFDRVGVASASEPIEQDFSRYQSFIAAGMHGEMQYLADAPEARRRLDTDAILEGAKSIICVADSYAGASDAAPAEARGVTDAIARYARGRDYHRYLRRRLRRLAAFVRTLAHGARARPMTDDAPVLERAWAARAGLGFVGKNGMLIAPGLGSFLLLGEVVTTLELVPDTPMTERCGTCTLCLSACPTDAFPQPFVLDARRCISYLTIELRAEMPESLRSGVGDHLFGCDDCQNVCPFNRGSAARGDVKPAYGAFDKWSTLTLEAIVELDEPAWQSLVQGSPTRRATWAGFIRNAVTALANRRDPRYRPLFERIAREHPEASVRSHAAWGLKVLEPMIAGAVESMDVK